MVQKIVFVLSLCALNAFGETVPGNPIPTTYPNTRACCQAMTQSDYCDNEVFPLEVNYYCNGASQTANLGPAGNQANTRLIFWPAPHSEACTYNYTPPNQSTNPPTPAIWRLLTCTRHRIEYGSIGMLGLSYVFKKEIRNFAEDGVKTTDDIWYETASASGSATFTVNGQEYTFTAAQGDWWKDIYGQVQHPETSATVWTMIDRRILGANDLLKFKVVWNTQARRWDTYINANGTEVLVPPPATNAPATVSNPPMTSSPRPPLYNPTTGSGYQAGPQYGGGRPAVGPTGGGPR